MLFDLRSRGRRRAVRVIYLGLALVMGGGLILFGVGAGNGFGGLLNSFTNNGAGGGTNSVNTKAEKAALAATRKDPTSPGAWANLVQQQWYVANQGSNFNSTTGVYSTAGRAALSQMTSSWQHYVALAKSPDPNVTILAAKAFSTLPNYPLAAQAWEQMTVAEPTSPQSFICLAATSYAAKQTRKGDLAAAQALKLVPKLQRLTIKSELTAAKTSPALAQSC